MARPRTVDTTKLTPEQLRRYYQKQTANQNAAKTKVTNKVAASSNSFRDMVDETSEEGHPSGGRVRVDIHRQGVAEGSLDQYADTRTMAASEVPDYLDRSGANKATIYHETHPHQDEQGNLSNLKILQFERNSGGAGPAVFGPPNVARSVKQGGALIPTPLPRTPNQTKALTEAQNREAKAKTAYDTVDMRSAAPLLHAKRDEKVREYTEAQNKYDQAQALGAPPTETRAEGTYTPPSVAPTHPAATWVTADHQAALNELRNQLSGGSVVSEQQQSLGDEHAQDEAEGTGNSGDLPQAVNVQMRRGAAQTIRAATKVSAKTGTAKNPELISEIVSAGALLEKKRTAAERAHLARLKTERELNASSEPPTFADTSTAGSSVKVPRGARMRPAEADPERQARLHRGDVSTTPRTPLHDLVAVAHSLTTGSHTGLYGGLKGVVSAAGKMGPTGVVNPDDAVKAATATLNTHPVVKGLLAEHAGKAAPGSTLRNMAHRAGVEVGPGDAPHVILGKAQAALKTYRTVSAKVSTKTPASKLPKVGNVKAAGYIGQLDVPRDKTDEQVAAAKKAVEEKAAAQDSPDVRLATEEGRTRHLKNVVGIPTRSGNTTASPFVHDVADAATHPETRAQGGGSYFDNRRDRTPGAPADTGDDDRTPSASPAYKVMPGSLSDVKLADAEKPTTPKATAADDDFYGRTPERRTATDRSRKLIPTNAGTVSDIYGDQTKPDVTPAATTAPAGAVLGRSSGASRGRK